jgi:hypothetical protein
MALAKINPKPRKLNIENPKISADALARAYFRR